MNLTPTHTLKSGRECELIVAGPLLSSVRVNSGAYWDRPKLEIISVLTSDLQELEQGLHPKEKQKCQP